MLLADWCAREGRGAITRLSLDTRLAYTTVLYAVQGYPTSHATADILHAATNGEADRDAMIVGQKPPRQRKRKKGHTKPTRRRRASSSRPEATS